MRVVGIRFCRDGNLLAIVYKFSLSPAKCTPDGYLVFNYSPPYKPDIKRYPENKGTVPSVVSLQSGRTRNSQALSMFLVRAAKYQAEWITG